MDEPQVAATSALAANSDGVHVSWPAGAWDVPSSVRGVTAVGDGSLHLLHLSDEVLVHILSFHGYGAANASLDYSDEPFFRPRPGPMHEKKCLIPWRMDAANFCDYACSPAMFESARDRQFEVAAVHRSVSLVCKRLHDFYYGNSKHVVKIMGVLDVVLLSLPEPYDPHVTSEEKKAMARQNYKTWSYCAWIVRNRMKISSILVDGLICDMHLLVAILRNCDTSHLHTLDVSKGLGDEHERTLKSAWEYANNTKSNMGILDDERKQTLDKMASDFGIPMSHNEGILQSTLYQVLSTECKYVRVLKISANMWGTLEFTMQAEDMVTLSSVKSLPVSLHCSRSGTHSKDYVDFSPVIQYFPNLSHLHIEGSPRRFLHRSHAIDVPYLKLNSHSIQSIVMKRFERKIQLDCNCPNLERFEFQVGVTGLRGFVPSEPGKTFAGSTSAKGVPGTCLLIGTDLPWYA